MTRGTWNRAGGLLLLLLLQSPLTHAATHSATIVRVGDSYGNLETDLAAATLALSEGARFRLACGEKTFEATWAVWYGDVPEGDWLGLTNEDGNVQIAINGGDADAAAGCTTGDVLTISTIP